VVVPETEMVQNGPSYRIDGAISTLVIYGVTGPVLIKIAQNVAKILPVNIVKSELLYSNIFQKARKLK